MQSGKIALSHLPFPSVLLNCNVKVYEITETEADGEQEILIYSGRAYYEHKAKTTETTTGKASGITGLIVIHGGFSHEDPFRGRVEIDGTKEDVMTISENLVAGKLYTTEMTLR